MDEAFTESLSIYTRLDRAVIDTPTLGICRNSEIYNHVELKERYLKGVHIVKDSKSDSAIIGHLYEVRYNTSNMTLQVTVDANTASDHIMCATPLARYLLVHASLVAAFSHEILLLLSMQDGQQAVMVVVLCST